MRPSKIGLPGSALTSRSDESDAGLIGELTQEEVIRMYEELVRPSTASSSRKKLSVQLISPQLREDPPPVPEGAVLLLTDEEEAAFKAGLTISSAATPVVSDLEAIALSKL